MNSGSKKFLSCLALALSLGKSAEAIDPLTIVAVISFTGSAYSVYSIAKQCCCERRNSSAGRIYDNTNNVDVEVFSDNNRAVAGELNNIIGSRFK